MDFVGDSEPLSAAGFEFAVKRLGVGPAEVWTLLSVETQACGFLPDRRPTILFERHVFHRETRGEYDATHPSISSSKPGGYLGGAGEYERLELAMNLDSHAALNSASWGIGQVMGMYSGLAGFASVESMATAMAESEDAQLRAVAEFLVARRLHEILGSHRWAEFAAAYNGPNYADHGYDARLAAAYAGFSSGMLPQIPVRQSQILLTFLGVNPGAIDGVPGKLTRNAVVRFREQHRLGSSSTIDDALIAALKTALRTKTTSA